jgi:hypothetical protein
MLYIILELAKGFNQAAKKDARRRAQRPSGCVIRCSEQLRGMGNSRNRVVYNKSVERSETHDAEDARFESFMRLYTTPRILCEPLCFFANSSLELIWTVVFQVMFIDFIHTH